MDKNTAKNCHLYATISQKLFSKSKSLSLNAAYEQTLTQKKVSSHGNFTHFHYKVKTPPEQIVLPIKKTLRKPIIFES